MEGRRASAHLCVGGLDGVSVAHGADVDAELAFAVSLPEELLHDAVDPLAVDVHRFGRVAQVGTVQHLRQQLQPAHTLGQLSLASVRDRLIEYQLRLG